MLMSNGHLKYSAKNLLESMLLYPLKSLGVIRGVGLLKADNHFYINVAQKNRSLVKVQNNRIPRLIATLMMVKSIFFFVIYIGKLSHTFHMQA